MKNFLKIMMIAAISMSLTTAAYSKDFKGVITYKISFPGTDLDPSTAAMMPKMATMTLRGHMSKLEIGMGQMGKQIQITNAEEKTVTTCLDMMGQKLYYVQKEDELLKDQPDEENISVEITDETKEIAGYDCTKAIVTFNDSGNESTLTIFFTEEIGTPDMNFDNTFFSKIPGAMLEFEIAAGMGGTMKMEAISVKKSNVSDSEFEVPEGFEKKTFEEFRQMMGGGM